MEEILQTVVVSESTYADCDQCDCTGKSSGSVPDIEKDGIEPEIVCMQVSRAEQSRAISSDEGGKSGVYPVIWRRGGMIPGILFAAASSGCGKTTITCGALRAWQRKGLKIKAWKCGPDYIDPMFHKQVLGIPGGNLDSFFLSKEALKAQYQQKNVGFDLAVMEGVMGYYDGLGGISTQASTYEVAQAVDVPVILILDGKGASLSLAAMLRGFLQYQKDSHIVGVILNRTSPMIGARLKPVLEAEGVKYLGCVPVSKEIQFDSRHLGLVMPEEVPQIQKQLDEIADLLEESVDLDGILELARSYAEKVENNEDAGLAKCQTSQVAMETRAAGSFTESRNPLRASP